MCSRGGGFPVDGLCLGNGQARFKESTGLLQPLGPFPTMTGAAHHQELLNIAPPAQSNLVGVEHQVEAVGELGAAHIAVGSANLVLQEEDFSSLHGIGGLQTLVHCDRAHVFYDLSKPGILRGQDMGDRPLVQLDRHKGNFLNPFVSDDYLDIETLVGVCRHLPLRLLHVCV